MLKNSVILIVIGLILFIAVFDDNIPLATHLFFIIAFVYFGIQALIDYLKTPHIDKIPPSGLVLKNEFCIVKFDPRYGVCYIKEKPSSDTNKGYQQYKIRRSYKSQDLWLAIIDMFEERTKCEHILELCGLIGVKYLPDYTLLDVQQQVENPVLKKETPKSNEPELKCKNEREVDL